MKLSLDDIFKVSTDVWGLDGIFKMNSMKTLMRDQLLAKIFVETTFRLF